MRRHFTLNRRVAAACAVAAATALWIDHCSAQPFIAADYATNATYATGWSAGQNDGYGFTAWDFDGTSSGAPIEQGMTFDYSSPFDVLGTAWTLYNPPGPGYGWLSEAGRGFTPLQPYQTFEVVIENPTNTYYGNGYTVELDSGTGNGYSGNTNTVQQVSAYTYGFFGQLGEWLVGDYYGSTFIGLNVTDTAPAGVRIDFTILPAGNYQLTMTPLNNPTNAQTEVGSLKQAGLPTDWMQFDFYNNPNYAATYAPTNEFYISSMTIAGPALNIQLVGTNAVLTWLNVSDYLSSYNMELESSTNLGPAEVWNSVPTSPAVVNGQNVVTNPIAGTQQFYRLYYP